jgi:hypothetical protein
MPVILFKVALAVATTLLGAWTLRTRLLELPEGQFRSTALALQLVPAVGLFIALYVVGHQEPTSDVPGYYLPAARSVLAGQIPFRDFTLSYAPLFAYVGAALAFAWNSGKVFAAFAILLNAFALLWWHAAASACFDRRTARSCTVLYATSGHVLVQALLGTNQAWVGAGLAASAMLMTRDRNVTSGIVQAAAACTTKVLAHLFWPVLWICASRRAWWLLAAILPAACVYAAFVALGAGAGLLYPLSHEGEAISPGNLPYLLDLALGRAGTLERLVNDGLALAALATATVWLYVKAQRLSARDRPKLLLAGLALTGLVFMLFSKKSFTGYLLFVMYPVVLMLVAAPADSRARIGFLLVFNALLVAEPSLWFHLGGNGHTLRAWLEMAGGPAVAAFVLVDVALLACYGYLAWLSVTGVKITCATVAGTVGANSCRAASASPSDAADVA